MAAIAIRYNGMKLHRILSLVSLNLLVACAACGPASLRLFNYERPLVQRTVHGGRTLDAPWLLCRGRAWMVALAAQGRTT